MENQDFGSVVNSNDAPYLNKLGRACGLATNYHAVTHPSLPNYLALVSGSTEGIADDGEPSAHRIRAANLFSELHSNWRALDESMPTNCDRVTSGMYAARHNPAVYFTNLESSCTMNDQPLGARPQLSADFTFITPNVCSDMHSCSIATGDAWLSRFVPKLLNGRPYRSGNTALFVTWDESNGSASNQVATYVIAPSTPRGDRVALKFTHYSLLRTTEQLLHAPFLGAARTARSMVGPFRL